MSLCGGYIDQPVKDAHNLVLLVDCVSANARNPHLSANSGHVREVNNTICLFQVFFFIIDYIKILRYSVYFVPLHLNENVTFRRSIYLPQGIHREFGKMVFHSSKNHITFLRSRVELLTIFYLMILSSFYPIFFCHVPDKRSRR